MIENYKIKSHLKVENKNRFFEQIKKDVNRSFNTLDFYKSRESLKKEKK
jgi:hypothetical protein